MKKYFFLLTTSLVFIAIGVSGQQFVVDSIMYFGNGINGGGCEVYRSNPVKAIQLADSSVIVSWNSGDAVLSPNESKVWVVKLSPQKTLLWKIGLPKITQAAPISILEDGQDVLIMYTYTDTDRNAAAIVRISPTGQQSTFFDFDQTALTSSGRHAFCPVGMLRKPDGGICVFLTYMDRQIGPTSQKPQLWFFNANGTYDTSRTIGLVSPLGSFALDFSLLADGFLVHINDYIMKISGFQGCCIVESWTSMSLGFLYNRSLAVDTSASRIYLTEANQDRIIEIDTGGRVLDTLYSPGSLVIRDIFTTSQNFMIVGASPLLVNLTFHPAVGIPVQVNTNYENLKLVSISKLGDSTYLLVVKRNYAAAQYIFGRITSSVGLPELEKLQVKAFPNPTTGLLHFSWEDSETAAECVLYDYAGRQLIKQSLTPAESTIDVSQLSAGMYFYRITTGNKYASGKIIVQQ